MKYMPKQAQTAVIDAAKEAITKANIKNANLKYCNCAVDGGARWSYPLFRLYSQKVMEDVYEALMNAGVDCRTDIYLDDDGDDAYGRPMTRFIYSVEMPQVVCEPQSFWSNFQNI
jgi:hypothetical protein